MPVKKGKGGKNRKKGKKNPVNPKSILIKEEGQEYGQVTSVLGNCRFLLLCADGKERLGILRGKMRKRQWVSQGSFVIVGIREFENSKCDIFHVYPEDQSIKVKKFFPATDETYVNEREGGFVFGDESDDECAPLQQVNVGSDKSNNGSGSGNDSESSDINIDDI